MLSGFRTSQKRPQKTPALRVTFRMAKKTADAVNAEGFRSHTRGVRVFPGSFVPSVLLG